MPTADERVLGVEFSDDDLSVSLRDGRVISVPLTWYPRLLSATPPQRNNWKIAGGGYGIHWPDVDEDLSAEVCFAARPRRGPTPSGVRLRPEVGQPARRSKPQELESCGIPPLAKSAKVGAPGTGPRVRIS